MADYLFFDEGVNELLDNGFPATCRWLLSTKPCSGAGAHAAGDTLSGAGVGEITGTGYGRQSQAEPAAGSRAKAFSQMTWDTGTATDWPASVKSAVLVTTADNSGKAIVAINLQAGGAARDMSAAHVQEKFTPTVSA
jgi:hypothetical protein